MDTVMDALKNAEEPEWVERVVVGGLRLWQVVFLCLAFVATCIVMVCCCFRFRIPRTKQQIEADYQRRMITAKFRQRLAAVRDDKMDAMSLRDGSLDAESGQKEPLPAQPLAPAPGGLSFVKFASRVGKLSQLASKQEAWSKSPSPAPSGNKMDF